MLTNAMVAPNLPAVDLQRARKFYEEKLGLMYVYQRAATKADHTVASFKVDNVEAEVKELKSKGVKFEDYDLPKMGIKTVNSIATMGNMKGAWFKDTEGNILSLVQM